MKPNFVDPDPGVGTGGGGFALFVGRLAEEKGIRPLLSAWDDPGLTLPLKVCGDGPLAAEVRAAAARNPAVQWLGRQPLDEVLRLMGEAAALVFPSVWYEGLPRTIVESFAKGTPVIASDLGSMAELVSPGYTGDLFAPGDGRALAAAVRGMAGNPSKLRALRANARREYELKYTAGPNYSALRRSTGGRSPAARASGRPSRCR